MRYCHFLVGSFVGRSFVEVLSEHFDLRIINFQKIIRKELRGESQLAIEARAYLDKGELVPDPLLHELLLTAIALDERPFILHHYPRTEAQFQLLNTFLREEKITLTTVWHLAPKNMDDFIAERFKGKGIEKYGVDLLQSRLLQSQAEEKTLLGIFKAAAVRTVLLDYAEGILAVDKFRQEVAVFKKQSR